MHAGHCTFEGDETSIDTFVVLVKKHVLKDINKFISNLKEMRALFVEVLTKLGHENLLNC